MISRELAHTVLNATIDVGSGNAWLNIDAYNRLLAAMYKANTWNPHFRDCIKDIIQTDIHLLSAKDIDTYLTFIYCTDRTCDGMIEKHINNGVIHQLMRRAIEIIEEHEAIPLPRSILSWRETIASAVYGLAVADAVGVPAEFMNREALRQHPVTDMTDGGAHNQPRGTWSDDTSMAVCLAMSIALKNRIDADDIMKRFCDWAANGEYTPHHNCFDIGNTVVRAIDRYHSGTPAAECGGRDVWDNGNGSLMRILPLAFYLAARYGLDFIENDEALDCIDVVSSITHAHPVSRLACGIYLSIAAKLMQGYGISDSVQKGVDVAMRKYSGREGFGDAIKYMDRILNADSFRKLKESQIKSDGYVVNTLEAAIWCLLNTDNYRDCVLKAVNLGSDTDTVAAVAGGLAGIYYGFTGIPAEWVDHLCTAGILNDSIDRLATYCEG